MLRGLACLVLAAALALPAGAAATAVSAPTGALAGLREQGPAPADALLRLAIELQPRDDLDALAAHVADPADAQHRALLSAAAFDERFGRVADGQALGELLRSAGANDVWVARSGLVVRAVVPVEIAQRLFAVRYATYRDGARTVVAPTGPLQVPAAGVRDVRGAVIATTPRLNDVRAPYTGFRGDFYLPARFRTMYDALPDGGDGQHLVLVEDASDTADLADVRAFIGAEGAPPGADAARVNEERFATKAASQDCGRDDRGQEADLDVDAAMTLAPRARITIAYDDVCSPGNDGTAALARALELDPTAIAFPFAVGPVRTGVAAVYGQTPLPYLEALVRGIPIVVSAGDDGAFGYRERGIDQPAVTWPCVLPVVICAGGTSLGERDTAISEAPWNDLTNATGGGISTEPRPSWQNAPSAFELGPNFVKQRMVPDVSADAGGHLRVFWHGYAEGGVGGTSESASLVAAQLAAINAVVPPERALRTAGDLYVLARAHPDAFREVTAENDRRFFDNTLRPRPSPLPSGFRGVLPSPVQLVYGCRVAQPQGCTVKKGYNAVTGIGSLKEKTAADALKRS